MRRLLLIDDTNDVLADTFSRPPLTSDRWVVDRARWDTFAQLHARRERPDVIVADVSGRQMAAAARWFASLRSEPTGSPTIAVLPSDVEAEFLRQCFASIDDFVLAPIRPHDLKHRIARILRSPEEEAIPVRDKLNSEQGLAHLVGSDPAFVREIGKIPLAARSDCEVLITGDTGTGKELCARAIHHLSGRSSMPFVCVDCGALPDQLFENELFGHERGAFTDAHRAQKGLVAVAEGGTLFLDEIDSLSLPSQAKLLRFLQDRSYKPLGAERFERADVRIVAATNRDLEHAVDERAFRRDLYFRINVLKLRMIPLSERAGDIELLARHFLAICCAEMRCPRKTLAASSLQLLGSLEWPGNIRELYNAIRRAVVYCEGPRILPEHLQPEGGIERGDEVSLSFQRSRALVLDAFERRYVEAVLRAHHGNITRAAQQAGKDRRVFGRLVKRLNIDPRHLE